eukprot:366381-Chlamydomonas_euryale.AAC.10
MGVACHGRRMPWASHATGTACCRHRMPWAPHAMGVACYGCRMPWASHATVATCHGRRMPWASHATGTACCRHRMPWAPHAMVAACHGRRMPRAPHTPSTARALSALSGRTTPTPAQVLTFVRIHTLHSRFLQTDIQVLAVMAASSAPARGKECLHAWREKVCQLDEWVWGQARHACARRHDMAWQRSRTFRNVGASAEALPQMNMHSTHGMAGNASKARMAHQACIRDTLAACTTGPHAAARRCCRILRPPTRPQAQRTSVNDAAAL